jgi:uncharacterized protein (TIGR02421 family)
MALPHSGNDHEPISASLISDVCARLTLGKPIRQPLPGGGMLHIDRMLPFLYVYRRNPALADEGTAALVMSEASYLVAPGTAPVRRGLKRLIYQVARTSANHLASFLIVEIWAGESGGVSRTIDELTGESLLPAPGFRIMTRRPHRPEGTVATLEYALHRVRLFRQGAEVDIQLHARNHPSGMTQLISETDAARINCHVLGLEVRPVFRDPATGEVYDHILRSLCRQTSRGLKKAAFAFALSRTTIRPEHYFSLGSSRLPARVFSVDRQLAEVSGQFKFLLLVTPMNAERSWHEFVQSGFRTMPAFTYRPLDADPLLLKRRLMNIATERVEDPTLAHVLRQTQIELDRQITMLADIGTPRFLPGSLQVFGGVDATLLALAREILTRLPRRPDDPAEHEQLLDARQFARMAKKEIKYYHDRSPAFVAQANVRDDMYSGLLATGGNLLIGRETRLSARRADALLQHEVGTHLVTYHNGAAQPLRLLKVGLAGYDALQEGFAVLAEYLVDGLSRGRMRTLAARVMATSQLVAGRPFAEVFGQLVDEFGFEPRAAYTITLRVFRGGGLTKDALYLRGLVEIISHFAKGGELEPLLIGKIARDHIPVIRELLLRGVIRGPLLRPRYLESPDARQRLAAITPETQVLDLIDCRTDGEPRSAVGTPASD